MQRDIMILFIDTAATLRHAASVTYDVGLLYLCLYPLLVHWWADEIQTICYPLGNCHRPEVVHIPWIALRAAAGFQGWDCLRVLITNVAVAFRAVHGSAIDSAPRSAQCSLRKELT